MPPISANEAVSITGSDPSYILVTNTLLFPLVAAADFGLSVWFGRSTFSGSTFLVAVLCLLLTDLIVDLARVQVTPTYGNWLSALWEISVQWIIVIAVVGGLIEVGNLSSGLSRASLWIWALSTPIFMWMSQLFLRVAFRRGGVDRSRRAVIVGVTDVGMRLELKIHAAPQLRTIVSGFFEDRSVDRLPQSSHERILGRPADLVKYIADNGIQVVYITLPMTRQQRLVDLLESLRDSTASVYFVPDLFVFNLVQARIDALGGIPLIAVCETPFYGFRAIAKRTIDIALATVLVLVLSPIFVFAAIAVKLGSPGPIFFIQKRYGLDGQEIWIYKFRSMEVSGNEHYRQVSRGDPRVTRIGSLLRRTSIDELPQLFNVLQGTMSIVGPRPHVVAVNEQYRRLIPGYMVRHKVRPGITGWAQVNGHRGGDDLEAMTKRIECDIEYLRHWSMGLDLRIILRTMLIVLRDRAAY